MATAEPTDHIGARIRYWRRRRGGMSQTTLARLAGLSQSFISNVESGHKSVERRSTLVALADGQLHLSASLACAVDKRPDDSTAHLREAEREARTLGDPGDGVGFNFSCFGPTNVGLWRMAVAVELGEHGKTVELAGKLDPNPLRMADRHYYYWLDYGRALAHSGKTDSEARAAFFRAEQAAPVPFSLNPMAHDAVLAMMNRAKRDAIPEDLRVLAHRLGIETTGFR